LVGCTDIQRNLREREIEGEREEQQQQLEDRLHPTVPKAPATAANATTAA
jgi:hypothetical protein